MPLIQPTNTDDRTPAQRSADEIRKSVTACFNVMLHTQRHVFRALWKDPRATPQSILDALGVDAAELFQMGAANVQTLLTFKPGCLQPDDYAPPFVTTINPDGTVTVSESVSPRFNAGATLR